MNPEIKKEVDHYVAIKDNNLIKLSLVETKNFQKILTRANPRILKIQSQKSYFDENLVKVKSLNKEINFETTTSLYLTRGLTEKAYQVLDEVGLSDKAQEWPARLSGGQKQRVALARALIHQPQLLLLDEPLGALDALTRIDMQQLIEKLWQKHGFTVVLVTHDVNEAVKLADRVILLEGGVNRIRYPGSPRPKRIVTGKQIGRAHV